MRHLTHSVQLAHLVQRVDRRRHAPVQREHAVFNQRGEGKVVEQVCERLPHLRVAVLAHALVVEAVHLSDLARLVVAAENRHSVRPSHLQCNQQCGRLHGVVPTIHVVSHEEIVCVGTVATDEEEFFQIIELPVNVSADLAVRETTRKTNSDGGADFANIVLFQQDLLRFCAQTNHLLLRYQLAATQLRVRVGAKRRNAPFQSVCPNRFLPSCLNQFEYVTIHTLVIQIWVRPHTSVGCVCA